MTFGITKLTNRKTNNSRIFLPVFFIRAAFYKVFKSGCVQFCKVLASQQLKLGGVNQSC